MKHKNIWHIGLLLLGILTLGACGGTSSGPGGPSAPPPDVALLYADDPTWAADVQAKVQGTGQVNSVTLVDVGSTTPTLAQLQAYDTVLVWSNFSFADAVTLGDNLADYVDACGGVVLAAFANYGTPYSPQGRFASSNYYVIPDGSSVNTSTQETLGVVNYSAHPTTANITSFDGGWDGAATGSWRPGTTSVVAGSTRIADWSDNTPLIATRTMANGALRVDLGMFPPSGDADSTLGFWDPSTDGATIMANALTWAASQKCVGVLHAHGDNAAGAEIANKLIGTGRFNGVSFIDADTVTSTLSELQAFDSVLISSDSSFADATVLGDNVADYVDAGGGAVLAVFSYNVGPLGGRFLSDNYFSIPANSGQNSSTQETLGTVFDAAHPIMAGVGTLDGGTASYRPNTTSIDASATRIADWTDGTPLVATRNIGGTRRADLGFYPPSNDYRADFWDTSTDGDLLMANALAWTGGFDSGLVRTKSADTFPMTIDSVTPTVTSTINVSGGSTSISEIKVHLDITHTWDSDLNITLIAPDATTIDLSSANGGSSNDYTATTFADNAGTSAADGAAPFTGLFIPEAALATLNGTDANGTWTLQIDDTFVSADDGTLNSWSISIR